jgi:hypothetical protein
MVINAQNIHRKNYGGMPLQKIAHSRKNKEWRIDNVDYIIGHGAINGGPINMTRLKDMQMHYDLYNSIWDESDIKYVTNPFQQRDGFPATARDFNIIRPIIDTLIGEEVNKAFTYTVIRSSSSKMSKQVEEAKEAISQYLLASVMAQMTEQDRAAFEQGIQSGELQPPEQVLSFLKKDYRDQGEEAAYHSIKYLERKIDFIHEFLKGWKDALISSEEIYHVYELSNNPMLERVNPMYFAYEYNPNVEWIQDSAWCVEHMRMSYAAAHDMLYDYLTDEDLTAMLQHMNGIGNQGNASNVAPFGYNNINFTPVNALLPAPNYGNVSDIDVWHVCWKSFRKIGFLTIIDPETGNTTEDVVDETYKPLENELIEWRWVTEVWHGYKVGTDIYVGIEPLPHQHFSLSNPNSNKLPYIGAVHSNTNSIPRSLVAILKPLQDLFIIVWYRLEIALARDGGKVPVIDISQIPEASAGMNLPKWLHYLKALGVYIINPHERNEYNPENRPAMNTVYTSIDMSMSQTIAQYAQLLEKIENMAHTISGVPPSREGITKEREAVGNVQSNITRSSNVTAPWFWVHSKVKEQALQYLLDVTKEVWRDSGKGSIDFIMDDGQRAFFTFTDDFFEDMDVFITSDPKEAQKIQQLQTLYGPALQNGSSLLDVAEVMLLENTTLIKNKLAEIEEKKVAQIQQAQQAQMQAEQQKAQQEVMVKQAELELQRYKIDADNQTKIMVAEIGALKGETNDDNGNGVLDPIEVANQQLSAYTAMSKANIDKAKIDAEKQKATKESQIKEREVDSKIKIEKSKIELERQKIRAAERLQKMKDEAALERERIKARTAIKNKVSGEK